MLFSKEVTEQYLYHYTTLEIAIEKILYAGKLRLSPFEQTNDPRESQGWGLSSKFGSDFYYPLAQFIQLVNEDRLKRCKVLCLTQDDMEHNRLGYGRRGFARARMWAQYASNHRGICLVFDTKQLDIEIKRTLASKGKLYKGVVKYTDSIDEVETASTFKLEELLPEQMETIVKHHIDKYANTMFFSKNRDWQDETEYRYVLYSDDQEYQFIPIDLILRGLVLGVDFPQAYYPVIDYFKNKYCLEVKRMGWYNGIPYIRTFKFF
ncbi:MAG: hypothetical protein H6Q70_973 [Firmicutes bacterium]|nr:hypothetical protein [Bacillota bacterium]